ncbi:MAG: PIN domain-containing protein [Thermoanaerobaculia bacterium]
MYLLDTNILSELIRKRPNTSLMDTLRTCPADALSTSCICLMELRHGAARSRGPRALWRRIEHEILERVTVLEVRAEDALLAGDLQAELWALGKPIETEDLLIGASALARGFTVVTHNVSHFRRIPGLRVEDWMTS